MFESAWSREDFPALGGPTKATCAAPSRLTAIESRWTTFARVRVSSSCAFTHFRMSAYGPLRYPGSSSRILRSSRTRSLPSLPTSRRLITCIWTRCGIGIASTLPSDHARPRDIQSHPVPPLPRTLDAGSGGLSVLAYDQRAPRVLGCHLD